MRRRVTVGDVSGASWGLPTTCRFESVPYIRLRARNPISANFWIPDSGETRSRGSLTADVRAWASIYFVTSLSPPSAPGIMAMSPEIGDDDEGAVEGDDGSCSGEGRVFLDRLRCIVLRPLESDVSSKLW